MEFVIVHTKHHLGMILSITKPIEGVESSYTIAKNKPTYLPKPFWLQWKAEHHDHPALANGHLREVNYGAR
jgi:hypothetical protein